MATLPVGCPPLPQRHVTDDIVAIVTINHPQALEVNASSSFETIRYHDRCQIYLTTTEQKSSFEFGRYMYNGTSALPLDVYLPNTKIAKRQFTLLPDYASNCCVLKSNSQTIATVNGSPTQKLPAWTKSHLINFPHTQYLDQSAGNVVEIHGLQLTIWLLQSPRSIVGPGQEVPTLLHDAAQNMDGRSEDWAQSRYFTGPNPTQVSSNSFRVIQRYTGATSTAKLFTTKHVRESRDREFRIMNFPSQVDQSIVEYFYCTDIGDIPAIITGTHEGFVPYDTVHRKIKTWHPGTRFQIATKMLRHLFPAVDFLHSNYVVHGQISGRSVLVRLDGKKLEDVLVVDYSDAWTFRAGEELPRQDMCEDGRAIMDLVDDCSSLWALRGGKPQDIGGSEAQWRNQTKFAADNHKKARKAFVDFVEIEHGDQNSKDARRLEKLLTKTKAQWSIAQCNQLHNATRRVVRSMTCAKLRSLLHEWDGPILAADIGSKPYMVLSLGHKYLDNLANKLFHGTWDLTPRDICATLKTLEGGCKDPWRSFSLGFDYFFNVEVDPGWTGLGPNLRVHELDLATYIVDCCSIHPEWADRIQITYEGCCRTVNGYCALAQVSSLRDSLVGCGCLSAAMHNVLRRLATVTAPGNCVLDEEYDVWYHMPSRMFNLTQLQRMAAPAKFQECVQSGSVKCENFAEVRGEPKLQGCYAPLALLPSFAQALGIPPENLPLLETSSGPDPADFSQVNHRATVILARTGLVSYATSLRQANQFSHCPQDLQDVESADAFLSTNFGDMKVLTLTSAGTIDQPRPVHWSKFKSAEEMKSPQNGNLVSAVASQTPIRMFFHELLAERKAIYQQPIPSPKQARVYSVSSTFSQQVESERRSSRPGNKRGTYIPERGAAKFNTSFYEDFDADHAPPEARQQLNLPGDSFSSSLPLTSFRTTEQDDVDRMLAELSDSDDEESGLTGYVFHGQIGDTWKDDQSTVKGSFTAKHGTINRSHVNRGTANSVNSSDVEMTDAEDVDARLEDNGEYPPTIAQDSFYRDEASDHSDDQASVSDNEAEASAESDEAHASISITGSDQAQDGDSEMGGT